MREIDTRQSTQTPQIEDTAQPTKTPFPFMYLTISAAVILIDQITKYIARYYLECDFIPHLRCPQFHSVSVIGDFFKLTIVYNQKAAFSMGFASEGINRIFFSVMAFAMVLFVVYMLKIATRKVEKIAFALIIGGAIGNLSDRIIHGAVTDFLDFDWPNWLYFERWPTFNIADSSIVCAAIMLLIYIMFFEKKYRQEQKK